MNQIPESKISHHAEKNGYLLPPRKMVADQNFENATKDLSSQNLIVEEKIT